MSDSELREWAQKHVGNLAMRKLAETISDQKFHGWTKPAVLDWLMEREEGRSVLAESRRLSQR